MPKVTKNTKKAPSKVKVGGAKKRRFSTPVIILIALLVVGALTVGGYFGYNKYQEHRLKAQAAGYQRVGWSGDITVSACKTMRQATMFGPLHKVKVIVSKSPNRSFVATLEVYRNGRLVARQTGSNQWWGGVVQAQEIWAASGDSVNLAGMYAGPISGLAWC